MVVVMMTVVFCAAAALAEDAYEVAWSAQIGTSARDDSGDVLSPAKRRGHAVAG